MRGSSQPSTRPVSTNHVSLRLLSTVYTKLSLSGGERGARRGHAVQACVRVCVCVRVRVRVRVRVCAARAVSHMCVHDQVTVVAAT
jgi:hypothetical protein